MSVFDVAETTGLDEGVAVFDLWLWDCLLLVLCFGCVALFVS